MLNIYIPHFPKNVNNKKANVCHISMGRGCAYFVKKEIPPSPWTWREKFLSQRIPDYDHGRSVFSVCSARIRQRGNIGDGIVVDVDLDQIAAVDQRCHVGDAVVFHQHIVQILIERQTFQGGNAGDSP